MNKIYKLVTIIVLVFCTSTFVKGAVWYSGSGDISTLTNWWGSPGTGGSCASTGGNPLSWASVSSDVFIIQTGCTMTGASSFTSNNTLLVYGSWTSANKSVGTIIIYNGGIINKSGSTNTNINSITILVGGLLNGIVNMGSSSNINVYGSWTNACGTVGNVLIDSSGALSQNGGHLRVSGNWTNNATFTYATNYYLYFSGTTNQTIIPGTSNFYYLMINNTGSSGNNTVTFTAIINVEYLCKVMQGIFQPYTGSTFGHFEIQAAGTCIAPASIYVSRSWVNNGSFVHNNQGTVNFSTIGYNVNCGTGSNKSFYNVTFATNALVNLVSDIVIDGSLTISSGAVLQVNAGYVLTVSGTITNNNGNNGLKIKSSATNTASLRYDGTTINATVERFVTGGASGAPVNIPAIKHYVSPSVSNATGAAIWDNSRGGYNIYGFNGSIWVRLWTGDALIAGKGYLVNYTSDKTISFTGSLNTSTINPGISPTNGVWNLLGNPYPCAISAASFVSANSTQLQGTLYFWDQTGTNKNDYAYWNTIGGVANGNPGSHGKPLGYIASGQGFMVASDSNGSTTAVFNTGMKVNANNNQFFKKTDNNPIQRCYIDITNPKFEHNTVLLGFLENASRGFDAQYDAYKLNGNNELSLYTLMEGDTDKYVIQGLPLIVDSQIVRLGLEASLDGFYTFNLSSVDNFDPDVNIYLKDLRLNKTIDFKNDRTYSFYATKETVAERFILLYKRGVDETLYQKKSDPIVVYSSSNNIYVTNLNNDPFNGSVQVFDVMGKEIYSSTLDFHTTTIQIPVNKPRGCFIVSIKSTGYSVTKKVVVE